MFLCRFCQSWYVMLSLTVTLLPFQNLSCFFSQRIYVTTGRQVKRIESIKRSPVFANFAETLNGVSSIRAYDQQPRFIRQADQLIDDNQRVWFAVFSSNRSVASWRHDMEWWRHGTDIFFTLLALWKANLAGFPSQRVSIAKLKYALWCLP